MEAQAVTRVGMPTLTRDPDVSDSSPSSSSNLSLWRKAGVLPGLGACPCMVGSLCASHSDRASQDLVPRSPNVRHQRL